MYRFLKEEYPTHVPAVSQSRVEAYYREASADHIDWPSVYPEVKGEQGPHFGWTAVGSRGQASLVSHIEALPEISADLVVSNVLTGEISRLDVRAHQHRLTPIMRTKHPCRIALGDLDGDAVNDYVVADLGTFTAKDTHLGQVLIQMSQRSTPSLDPVLTGRGRIADVKLKDLNHDGWLDIIVAEFGWHKTGGVHILWNGGAQAPQKPTFTLETISKTPGAISLDVGDMNADGHEDIVVNYAQHFERIDILYNSGSKKFAPHTIFSAPTPMWGSMAVHIVDLDADNKLDVIHINGDNLDAPKLARFQGVYWFKNEGRKRFSQSKLAELPGAHSVTTGDYDGDKRTDIVAVANLPKNMFAHQTPKTVSRNRLKSLDGILLITQPARGRFTVRSIHKGSPCFSAVASKDFDGDGDLDIAVGAFGMGWSLLGFSSSEPQSAEDPLCSQGQVYLLHNQPVSAQTPISPPSLSAREQLRRRMSALESLCDNDPDDARNRVNLGSVFIQTNQLSRAVTTLQDAIKIDPKIEGAHLNLAIAYERMGNLEGAEASVKRELALSEESSDAYNQYAVIHFRRGRLEAAIDEAKRAISIRPNTIPYLENLGTFYAISKRYPEAIEVFNAILKIDVQHLNARRSLNRLEQLNRK